MADGAGIGHEFQRESLARDPIGEGAETRVLEGEYRRGEDDALRYDKQREFFPQTKDHAGTIQELPAPEDAFLVRITLIR